MLKYATIRKDIILDEKLSDNAFLAYIGISLSSNISVNENSYSYNCKKFMFSIKEICMLLYDKEVGRRSSDAIICGVQELISKKYITNEYSKSGFYYCSSDYFIINDKITLNNNAKFFINITREEVNGIMNLNTHSNRNKILRFYCSIISSFNRYKKNTEYFKYSGKVLAMNQGLMSKLFRIDKCTISEYLNILEENKYIYIFRSYINGNSNVYSLCKDKYLCDEFVKEIYGERYSYINKYDQNFRSVATSALWIEKWYNSKDFAKLEKYSNNDLLKIKKWAEDHNKKPGVRIYNCSIYDDIIELRNKELDEMFDI